MSLPLSRLTAGAWRLVLPSTSHSLPRAAVVLSPRPFSSNKPPGSDHEDDFFGNAFDDGPDKLGPTLPPNYVRDATTGRLTGEVQSELTAAQQALLRADPLQQEEHLAARVQQEWSKDADADSDNKPPLLHQLGQRIRKAQGDLNVVGRSPAATTAAAQSTDTPTDSATQRLTAAEMQEFRAYMRKHHKVELQDDDMPVADTAASTSMDADSLDWALRWRTQQAQRQMDDVMDDNPYVDIMPQDLSTSPLVNRKHAKPLPRELLSYNNVALLQSFLTETGQVRARVQSRLGARDQRRIAKLVKRARALGLVPYQGPFRVEQHGWVHDPTLAQPRPWEVEMERRGLTLPSQRKNSSNQGSSSSN